MSGGAGARAASAGRAAAAARVSVAVVAARPVDLDAIIALERRCFTAADHFSRATWRHLLGRAARVGTSLTLVVREGGAVVAAITALLRSTSAAARIYSLAVDPACQGRGLARELFSALVRKLPQRITALTLEVREDNAAACALYERLGMSTARRMPGWYPDGGDALQYRAPRAAVRTAARPRA